MSGARLFVYVGSRSDDKPTEVFGGTILRPALAEVMIQPINGIDSTLLGIKCGNAWFAVEWTNNLEVLKPLVAAIDEFKKGKEQEKS